MKYTYDPIADAVSIAFQKGKVFKTEEIAPGVMLDFDKKGVLLYIEILDVSKRFKKADMGGVFFEPKNYSKKQINNFINAK